MSCWGIDAHASILSEGEIDFAFSFEGRHFVGEAKWESTPADTGAIAKLQKRLRQRLGGTTGIFLSIAGFSPDALNDLKQGEQLNLICMDRDHLEAMLTGFVPPAELIAQLVHKASLMGEGYSKFRNLFDLSPTPKTNPRFEHPEKLKPLVIEAVPGFMAEVILCELPFGQSGVAELRPGRILLTTSEGILLADLQSKTIESWLNFPNCSRSPLVQPDNSVFVIRRHGIARVHDGEISVVVGALEGAVCLSSSPDGRPWAFSNGTGGPVPAGAVASPPFALELTCVPPAEEHLVTFDLPAGSAHVGVALGEERFLVCGNGVAVVSPGGTDEILSSRDNFLTNAGGLVRVSRDEFLVACNNVELWTVDLRSRQLQKVAKLALAGSVHELNTSAAGGGYLFCHYENDHGKIRGIVVRWWRDSDNLPEESEY